MKSEIEIIQLKQELKSLIKGSIKDIGRFDDILRELEKEAGNRQRELDRVMIEDLLEKFF